MQTPTHAPYISLLQLFKRPSMVIHIFSSLKNPFPFEFLELLVDFFGIKSISWKNSAFLLFFLGWFCSIVQKSSNSNVCGDIWQLARIELGARIINFQSIGFGNFPFVNRVLKCGSFGPLRPPGII